MCDVTGNEKETHTCELKFGSWVYNANQMDLISVSIPGVWQNIFLLIFHVGTEDKLDGSGGLHC